MYRGLTGKIMLLLYTINNFQVISDCFQKTHKRVMQMHDPDLASTFNFLRGRCTFLQNFSKLILLLKMMLQ